jgi:hypothetical protein
LPGTAFGIAPAGEADYVSLKIQASEYVLEVVESAWDQGADIRHVTAAVVSDPGGYARFTVDEFGGLVSGTMETNRGSYRFIPSLGIPLVQLVYPYHEASDEPIYDDRILALRKERRLAHAAIERRHAQIQLVAKLRPSFFLLANNELTVILEGQDLARISPSAVYSPNEIVRMLVTLRALTRARGDETVRIDSVAYRDNGGDPEYDVSYRQVVAGLPIRREQRLVVGIDGKVRRLYSSLVDPSIISGNLEKVISAREALELAVAALEERHGPGLTFDHDPTRDDVGLNAYAIGSDIALVPTWQTLISITSLRQSEGYRVAVNLLNGDVTMESATEDAFRHNVYKRVSGTPTGPSPTDTVLVWEEIGTSGLHTCNSPGDCSDPDYLVARNILNKAEQTWEQVAPNNCCAQIGNNVGNDNTINVIVRGGTSSAGSYFGASDSILLGSSVVQNVDVIIHEAAHAYAGSGYGQNLYTPPGQLYAGALREGFADAMAATWADLNSTENVGQPWVMWDGTPGSRDLRVGQSMSTLENTQIDSHEAGKAIGNFFYRLRVAVCGSESACDTAKKERLARLVIEAVDNITDVAMDGNVDAADFKAVLDQMSTPGETELQSAIDTVWNAMGGGGGGGGSPPGAPGWIIGGFMYCVAPGTGVHGIGWEPKATATLYGVYYSPTPFISWSYAGSTPVSGGTFYNTVTVRVKTQACNAYGCSALSSVYYEQYSPCGWY